MGIDPVEDVLAVARRHAAERLGSVDAVGVPRASGRAGGADAEAGPRVSFRVGDVYSLDFADDVFDVVHAHQVLQHLSDPVAALREMRRVTRPGGLIAVRDGDYGGMTWHPASRGLDQWSAVYHRVTAANGVDADAGRRLLSWALEAGLQEVSPSADVWCFATPEEREFWAGTWSERVVDSAFADQAVRYGLATRSDLESMRDAWSEWGEAPDGWFAVLHGQVLATA